MQASAAPSLDHPATGRRDGSAGRAGKPLPGHRAAQKIRAWRLAQQPRLSAAEFGERYGVSMPQVYRFEAGTRVASVALALRLERDGVCAVTDWHAPAEDGAA